MISTPEAAAAEIQRLKLPTVFQTVWNGTQPEVMRREWRKPRVYFDVCNGLAERVTVLSELCPLWEQNGEAIIGCLNGARFIRFYYEDAGLENPAGSISVIGENYQQFATSILVELVEAGLWDDFDELAELLCYNYSRELRGVLEAYTDDHGEADLDRFRKSVR